VPLNHPGNPVTLGDVGSDSKYSHGYSIPAKQLFVNGNRERNKVKSDRIKPHPIRSLRYASFPVAFENSQCGSLQNAVK